jgi:hypothetical protein
MMVGTSYAIEVTAQKNVAYTLKFPIKDANGDPLLDADSSDDCEYSYRDAAGAWSDFADMTNDLTEDEGAGATGGWYTLVVAQTEMNHEWIAINCMATSAKDQGVLIRTVVGNPLNMATTDDGSTINVTTGKIDEVATLTGNTAQTGDAYSLLNTAAGEPTQGQCSAVSLSPVNKLRCNYKFMRNKLRQSNTTTEVYADDGTTVDEKSTVSDDDTYFIRGEFVTGP